MKINTSAPHIFVDGELLDPVKANGNLQACINAESEASSRRYSRSMLVLRFQTDCGAGYTQALSAENRSFRIMSPKALVIERAFWAYEGTGADIAINLTEVASGLAPAGFVNPLVSVAAGAPEATDLDIRQIPLAAGVHYKLTMTAAGAFTGTKAELVLHVAADRFQGLSGADELQVPLPAYLTEVSTLAAATWNAHVASAVAPCDANLGDGYKAGYKPMFFHFPGLTSGTAVALTRWDVPRADSALRRQRIVAFTGYAVLASNGAAGQTVTWSVLDQAGVTVASFVIPVDGVTYAHLTAHSLTISLQAATALIRSNTSLDFRIVVATNGATTIQKTYAFFWLE